MKIHEYQAKELFRSHGVAVPRGEMAETAEKALAVAETLGYPCVVKAQVHAGGRGKAGGIRLARSRAEAEKHISAILGMTLVSPQTGPEGRRVRKLLVEQGLEIRRELYLAILLDRECEMPVIIASCQGGMEIESVARDHPQAIFRVHVHPASGLFPSHIRTLAFQLGLNKAQQQSFTVLLAGLYDLFLKSDASLVEINPLIVTAGDEVLALDAKVNFDDNALFRHADIAAWRDTLEEEPLEVEAAKYELNYIRLDGSIGCMVNGAGLAMATMDIIKFYGGEPANFLDVGGATSTARVKEAFKILLADPNVRAVFVNIFGGIVRTDLVASGIVEAARGLDLRIPVVIRLVGTNEEEGQRILRESRLDFVTENVLAEAVRRVVELARGA
ncbi:MAG: ADP-forming succinate--CoA ligase subunit beta [Acidobacteria bacterium]|jgi:succinyl-CoA synthetase beta subunit|nr:ADP-forming succinate--CoA ligase subunit beta [Acidobacteriota bacterium]